MMFKVIRNYTFSKEISTALQVFFKETKSTFMLFYPQSLLLS